MGVRFITARTRSTTFHHEEQGAMRTFHGRAWVRFLVALSATVAVGCGGDDEGGDTDDGSEVPEQPKQVIDLVVDASRDGVPDASDPLDQDHQLDWNAEFGASFLVNIDDDDLDGIRDFEDDPPRVNGDSDLADMARFLLAPWPEAPDGTVALIDMVDAAGQLDWLAADNVRIWVKGLDGNWYPSFGAMGACGAEGNPCTPTPNGTFQVQELRAGLEFAIEGRRFRTSTAPESYSGELGLRLTVVDATGKPVATEQNPTGTDQVKLRVAPWILFGNLSPFDQPGARVWSYEDSYEDSQVFVEGLRVATEAAGIEHSPHKTYHDQWTQDFFQTAYTAIPAAGGGVHGMRVANARPWSQGGKAPIEWLDTKYLGPDHGTFFVYKKEGSGDTGDSHGNHDLIPPYDNNGQSWPLGRIIVGESPQDDWVLPETKDFYAAQSTQGPPIFVKSSWLWVGHVDEALSYVPAATPRGWKLLAASPRAMIDLLEAEQAKGNGSALLFEGKKGYIGNGETLVPVEKSIDATLADEDLMAWADEAQAEIDDMVEIVRAEVGLADDEIVEIPVLYEDLGCGSHCMLAWTPGTVNMLVFGDYVVIPRPFGPKIGGSDVLEKDLEARLGTSKNQLGKEGSGLKVYFTDDWSLYHINMGEVHCGSNPEAPPPYSSTTWWETGR